MDVGDLLGGDAFGNQFVSQIIVHVEAAVVFGSGEVTEGKLGGLPSSGALPDLIDVVGAGADLASIAVRQQRINQPLIQRQFTAIVGNHEHIVLAAVHHLIADTLGPLTEVCHHLLLMFGGFQHHMVVVGLGHGEIEHISRLNICDFFEHTHQFRQIVELGKPGLGPVAGALRGQLYGGHCLAKGGGPGIKMQKIIPLQGIVLEVFLHGIHLHHGVGDRGAGGKDHATAPGQLIQVAALHVEVAGLLCFRLADAAHITHFRVSGQIFVIMCLVDEKPVHTQLLKGHDVIFAALVVELIQLGLQALFGALHLLDGEVVAVAPLQVTDAVQNLPQLLLQDSPLPLQRHRDFLQLGMSDDDGVVVAGGNAPAKLLAVFRLKVLFCGHENVGRRVELEIFSGPLLSQMVGDGNERFAAQP